MSKEDIKDKIAAATKAAAPQNTKQTPAYGQSMTVDELNWWLGEGLRRQKFDSQVIDLKEIFKEKIQYLLFGKPLIIELDQDKDGEIDQEEEASNHEEVKKFVNQMKLQETLFANEGNVFERGRGYVVIDRKPNGKASLRLAEPGFPNTVTRIGHIAVAADIYMPFLFDKVKYYMRTTYTQDKIVNRIFTVNAGISNPNVDNLSEVKLGKFNKALPEQLKIKGEMKNPYQFIPVVEITYKPTADYSWDNKDKLAPFHKIKGIQQVLNEGTKAMRLELYLNRTKILVDEDMLNSDDKGAMKEIAEAGILGLLKDTGGIDGDGKMIEVLQGDPKVEQYWENINNTIAIAAQALKLSELDQEGADSATGEIFNKGNDVETANTLQIFRQEAIAEILTKAWAIEKSETFTEDELDTSKWSVQLIPNVIMNEAKMTEIVTQQLSAGLINMTQALVKLEGISSSDAKTKLSQDDGIYNPSLEAVSSFTDNGEDGDGDGDEGSEKGKKKTTGSGKEVVGGK